MSFDVFLQRFADGEPAEVDRRAVRDVVKAATSRRHDDSGFYVVTFPDGVDVEFSARGLESEEFFTGCAFHIRAISDGLIKFMLDVARAGDMIIIPAMEGNPVVLVSESQAVSLPSDMRERFRLILVRSPAELGAVLSGGFEGWSAYRDQVVRQLNSDRSRR